MIQRKPIFVVPNNKDAFYAHMMKKDFFHPELPNHLYLAFGPSTVFKVTLDAKDLEKSHKERIYT